ncbi:hypothetical protein KDH_36870 [Dictyobacter sp. S3.2.2.5]|uniref:Blue (type 1) copper domain-containing protein n=1 Tax=Dictyobacter halimunensis TaxID=3026934 RepID=A0ABQ6FTC2_9CHLR|nr:hypothetical protein KDH_36870 [Dictyobacter sp. S3.2.2.5]
MKQRSLMTLGALLLTLFLAACGGSPGNTAEKTSGISVPVNETDFHIDSAVTSFSPGTRYHFVVTNNGKTAHEFMIMPSSQGSMGGMSMGDMDHMALASLGNVKPGETKTLDYTFPSSSAGSHPELACYLPGHYEAGMKQSVAVTS